MHVETLVDGNRMATEPVSGAAATGGRGEKMTAPGAYMVARGELNHRHADFQSGEGDSRGLLIKHLSRLPAPPPGTPRHSYGTPNLSSTHSWHSGPGQPNATDHLSSASLLGRSGKRAVP